MVTKKFSPMQTKMNRVREELLNTLVDVTDEPLAVLRAKHAAKSDEELAVYYFTQTPPRWSLEKTASKCVEWIVDNTPIFAVIQNGVVLSSLDPAKILEAVQKIENKRARKKAA